MEVAPESGEADAAMNDEAPEGDGKAVAHCRFYDAEGAQKAMECLADAQIEGEKVTCTLLTGESEDAFWADLNAYLKVQHEKGGGKGKGKDKGKGKGKGKGKDKGKGK